MLRRILSCYLVEKYSEGLSIWEDSEGAVLRRI